MGKVSQRDNVGISGKRPFAGMSKMRLKAGGVDMGAHEIVGCIPGDEENTQEVQTFGTYTSDLAAIGDWFQTKGITSVAMESTGVYWMPVFEYLESLGIECCLISAALKEVPGRKTDVLDSQWIQTLPSYGLLNASFRPEADIVALRTLLRHRAQLVEHRYPHILHMQKALLQMNLQLGQVLTSMGTDMSKFPNKKHLCSWLGLAPKNEVSGGKTLKSRTLKTKNRAGQAFRLAARSQVRSDTEFGAFYRRMKSRVGPAQAMVATAHKMARVVFHMLNKGEEYQPLGTAEYEQQLKERQIRFLKRKAAKLGLEVVPI